MKSIRALHLSALAFWPMFSWPASGWLAAVTAIAILFGYFKNKLLGYWPENSPPGFFATFFGLTAASISHTARHVAYGIAIVAFAQIAVALCSKMLTPADIALGEEQLSFAFQAVAQILTYDNFLTILGIALLFNLLLPYSGLVGKFVYAKSAISKVFFVLLGITSFSFFSTEAVRQRDPDWRKAEYVKARLVLNEIGSMNRETMAAAWLEKEVKSASPETAQDYANFFRSANSLRPQMLASEFSFQSESFKHEVVRDAARGVAGNAPKVNEVTPEKAAHLTTDPELSLLEAKVTSAQDTQTLAELRKSNERLSAAKARYAALRKAAVEAAAETVAQFVPQSERALVRAFVEETASSVARSALKSLKPFFPAEQAAAKAWVETVTPSRSPGAAVEAEWKIGLRHAAHVPTGVPSQTAMALFAARLQTNAVRAAEFRAAEMRRFNATGIGRAVTPRVRVPRVRIRF